MKLLSLALIVAVMAYCQAQSYSSSSSTVNGASHSSCSYDDGNNKYQFEYSVNPDGSKVIISASPDNMENPLEKLDECLERTNVWAEYTKKVPDIKFEPIEPIEMPDMMMW